MNPGFGLAVAVVLATLALVAYIDRIYFEMGKFLSREYTENIDAWETRVEPKLRLSRESAALSASVLRQIALLALAFLLALRLRGAEHAPVPILRAAFELLLCLLVFDRLIPQLFFLRTRGEWIARIRWLIQALFYLALPVTLTISLLLSIAALAEPEAQTEDAPGEAMDALLEAGEEEGVLDEEDRELVRNVVEFGDKIVREVMTPRPRIVAIAEATSLADFMAAINEHGFSRVPVFRETLDHITGIAFARDLLPLVANGTLRGTVAAIARPAMFIPETKKVNELLQEMRREKQHMSIVIDEYGGVAGLVTIEDLLETIVGSIEDEHDTEGDEVPVPEADGGWIVPGGFETARLRELFTAPADPPPVAYDGESDEDDERETEAAEQALNALLAEYDAATVAGLVSEIAGHIPLPGEVVTEGPLRLEVLASTDRRIDRVRVHLLLDTDRAAETFA